MRYNEVKQYLCKIKLQNCGLVIAVYNPRTYITERTDVIKTFYSFKMYNDFVEIVTLRNTYMYALEEIAALISYEEWRGVRENADLEHLNMSSVPIYDICEIEAERAEQHTAYQAYQFENFLNQTK